MIVYTNRQRALGFTTKQLGWHWQRVRVGSGGEKQNKLAKVGAYTNAHDKMPLQETDRVRCHKDECRPLMIAVRSRAAYDPYGRRVSDITTPHNPIMAIAPGLTAAGEGGGSSYFLDPTLLSSRARPRTSVGNTKRANRPHRAKSASNILDSLEDFHRRLHDSLDPPSSRRHTLRQDGVTDLVDFLRNHEPPRDNFMSIPEDGTDDERGRWLRWAKIPKRSKSAAREPPSIRLPDTAVSGTTIGGHRHIAITIPLEASPMGNRPRSQYPIYTREDLKANGGNVNPIRTVVNEKGMVTVLKTASEGRQTPSSTSHFLSRPYTQCGPLPRTPSRGGRAGIQGFFPPPPPLSRGTVSLYQRDNGTNPEMPMVRPSSQGTASGFPTRGSSMGNRTLGQPMSIDGILSQPGSPRMNLARSRSERQPRINYGSSAMGEDDWPLRDKKLVRVKSSPTAMMGKGAPAKEAVDTTQGSGDGIPGENRLGSCQDDSSSARPVSAHSRRDRVRERKHRDMEALRNKRQQEDSEKDAGEKRQPTFSPIQVVINVEPCPTPEDTPPTPALTYSSAPLESEPLEPEDQVVTGMPPDISDGSRLVPSPPPHCSPVARHNSLDRTSLARRREWKAFREQGRTPKEVRAAVQARAKQFATRVPEELRDNTQALDKEILRLYEAYREHRFRDMERRVDRLERNGDVWLRALVPVLDNLHRNAESSSQENTHERAYMSDDEAAGARRNREFASAPLRRACSSHRVSQNGETRMYTDTSGQIYGEGCCGSAGSDDVTGLGTIEPLMRELAGAARLRQMRQGGVLHPHCQGRMI